MSEFVLKPKEQEVEEKAPEVQFDAIGDELSAAERVEGEELVTQAVLEVQLGIAQPEALLEWIDDLRDPQREQRAPEDDNLERSFTMDFIPDTARDNAANDVPPADDYMFFSANRRSPYTDDDEGGGGGGGGGGGDGEEGKGDEPADGADDKKKSAAPGAPAKGKPAKAAKPDAKQPSKPESPPPGKGGGGGKKPDGK